MREIRKIENRSKANYIRLLQQKGLLKKYISPKGYVSYEPEELKQLLKKTRKGRPPKNTKGE